MNAEGEMNLAKPIHVLVSALGLEIKWQTWAAEEDWWCERKHVWAEGNVCLGQLGMAGGMTRRDLEEWAQRLSFKRMVS